MGLRVKPVSGYRAESCWGQIPAKAVHQCLNNYKAEFGLKQHLFCKACICTFSFFICLINPQLTSLYFNFSYGSKKSPAKYFGTQKVVGLFLKLAPTFKSGGLSSPSPPAMPPLGRRLCCYTQKDGNASIYRTCNFTNNAVIARMSIQCIG